MGEGDPGRDRDHTTDSQRDPQAPIHLSGASIGHERDDRARRDKGEPKALAFDRGRPPDSQIAAKPPAGGVRSTRPVA